jgi:dynactin 1
MEFRALPPLPEPVSRLPTPPLDAPGPSDSDDSDTDDGLRTPSRLHSLSMETKLLYRDVIHFSSSPRVVDLSIIGAKRGEAHKGKIWVPRKKTPAHQVWERKMEAERLSRRVQVLLDRTSTLSGMR